MAYFSSSAEAPGHDSAQNTILDEGIVSFTSGPSTSSAQSKLIIMADCADDGRIGKEIDWSLVIPSITRPVWEPPALEVLDSFEQTEFPIFKLNYDGVYVADKEVETTYADIASEIAPLKRYHAWVIDTKKAAIVAGDQEKARFYQDLIDDLIFEYKKVRREAVTLWNDNGLGSPMSRLSVDGRTHGEGVGLNVEAPDENSNLLGTRTVAEWNQWIGDFISNIDFDNIPGLSADVDVDTAEDTLPTKGKKESVFTAIGRRLYCFPCR